MINYKTILNYATNRIKELSTVDGTVIVAVSVAYLMLNSVAVYVAYGAIVYGAYRILKAD